MSVTSMIQAMDQHLIQEGKSSRYILIDQVLVDFLKHLPSKSKKRDYFNLSYREENDRFYREHGYEKYVVIKGQCGGFYLSDEYLKSIGKNSINKRTVKKNTNKLDQILKQQEEIKQKLESLFFIRR